LSGSINQSEEVRVDKHQTIHIRTLHINMPMTCLKIKKYTLNKCIIVPPIQL